MEISGTGVSEDRIAALEKRLREMDALVKGLLDELLDFKAVAMTLSRQTAEDRRQELRQGPVLRGTASPPLAGLSASPSIAASSDGLTVIRPRGARQPDIPAEPAMARIMQDDGTMKLEPRYGDRSPIDSSAGYGGTGKGTSARSRQNPLIYAEEDKSGPAKV
ncbi:MAG: hypothetical protein ABSB80_11310 [Methanoregula sp.]|jgi:hypothetical protein|uniref:hypothetical protein n=1 Tax=Methanoregula sp. TaxID=2052170 RepID=UPI003D0A8D56